MAMWRETPELPLCKLKTLNQPNPDSPFPKGQVGPWQARSWEHREDSPFTSLRERGGAWCPERVQTAELGRITGEITGEDHCRRSEAVSLPGGLRCRWWVPQSVPSQQWLGPSQLRAWDTEGAQGGYMGDPGRAGYPVAAEASGPAACGAWPCPLGPAISALVAASTSGVLGCVFHTPQMLQLRLPGERATSAPYPLCHLVMGSLACCLHTSNPTLTYL